MQVIDKLKHLSRFGPQPSTILLSLRGQRFRSYFNQVVETSNKTENEIYKLVFSQTRIIWSCILPRTFWRHSQKNDKMEAARRRLNSFASALIKAAACAVISYPDIKPQPAILSSDGVHLSKLGNSILLNTLQGGL